jgi:Flp pilus assembly protein TadD
MADSTPTPANHPPARRSRIRWIVAGAGLLGAAVIVVLWFCRDRPAAPIVPEPALDAAEPEVRNAIQRARDRVLENPKSAGTWGDLGMVLRAHAYDVEADICFREAAERDPGDPRWPYYRGLYALLRDPANALPFLRKAAQLAGPGSPQWAAVQLRLAEALIERGELDEAEPLVTGVLAETAEDPRANYDAGLIRLSRSDPKGARAALGKAVDSPFARRKATAQMAMAARLDGDSTTATRLDREVQTLPADLPWVDIYVSDYLDIQLGLQARFQRAEDFEAEGRRREAAQEYVAIAADHPGPRAYVSAGTALAELGDYAAAERYLRACLQIEPNHTQANYFLAVTLFFEAEKERTDNPNGESARAKYADCADHARRCLERKPDHGLAHQFLGRALLRLGDPAEAVRHLRLAAACRPEMVESHISLAEGLLAANDQAGARKAIEAAEQIAGPDDPRVRQLRERLGK